MKWKDGLFKEQGLEKKDRIGHVPKSLCREHTQDIWQGYLKIKVKCVLFCAFINKVDQYWFQ